MRLTGINPGLAGAADYTLELAAQYGLRPEVTSVYRSISEQKDLRLRFERCVAQGIKVYPQNPNPACRYPANRPGDSAHNWGLAWDSWVKPEDMPLWTAIRRAVGWQVPDNDLIHAELPEWRKYVSR